MSHIHSNVELLCVLKCMFVTFYEKEEPNVRSKCHIQYVALIAM